MPKESRNDVAIGLCFAKIRFRVFREDDEMPPLNKAALYRAK